MSWFSERGDYFTKPRKTDTRPIVAETAIHDLLRPESRHFDDIGICRLLRRFPMPIASRMDGHHADSQ